MTNQISVVRLNNSSILSEDGPLRFGYTKLVPTTSSLIGNKQYLQISKDNELHLIETVSIMGKLYRGVTIDNVFWFIVEDLVELTTSSASRLALIEKLLNNIDNSNKGFIQCVDAKGDREYVLMVSMEGIRDKLFTH